jgi:hypothetical protein
MPPDPETGLTRGKFSRGSLSTNAQAAAKQQVKSSSGNRGLTTSRSRSLLDHENAQTGVLVNPAKDEQISAKKSRRKSRSRNVDSSSSLLDTAGRIARSEGQDPVALPRRIPSLHNIRFPSNTLGPLPPAQEQDLSHIENVEYSDGGSNDKYNEDDNIYPDTRAISEKLATPAFKQVITQEEYEALRYQQFQKQQHEAYCQMYLQQQQTPEVAQAIAPKPSGSRSTTTMLGIGEGGSSVKPQSEEKSLRRKNVKLEDALKQANSSAMNLDHHYRKLWSRASAQSEELQRSQHQVHRLLDDNRSLTHELEAVKAQLADAKTLPKVRGKELKVDTTDVDQKANEEEPWDMPEGPDILLTTAIQMVDVLNVEVRRAAAVLGRVLEKTKFEERQRQTMQITEKARLMLGENMVALLSEGLPERARVDPLIVQVVLQVAITNWCKTTISSWKPGNSDVSNLLVELYSKIREVGKSASTFKNNPQLRQKYLFRRSNVSPPLAVGNLGTSGIFIQRLVPRSPGWIARYSCIR